jgi:hypothetical protein
MVRSSSSIFTRHTARSIETVQGLRYRSSTMSSKTEGASAVAAASKGDTSNSAKAEKSLIEALEEDDEFEEFQPEHWSKSETSINAAMDGQLG